MVNTINLNKYSYYVVDYSNASDGDENQYMQPAQEYNSELFNTNFPVMKPL